VRPFIGELRYCGNQLIQQWYDNRRDRVKRWLKSGVMILRNEYEIISSTRQIVVCWSGS
jgi:hypothetical protein